MLRNLVQLLQEFISSVVQCDPLRTGRRCTIDESPPSHTCRSYMHFSTQRNTISMLPSSSHSQTPPSIPHTFHQPPSSFTSHACISYLLFLCSLSSLLSPSIAVPNRALQAGWSPNSSEVILNGDFVSDSLQTTFPSWQPFPTLYLWLSNSSVSPISYRAVGSTTSYYLPAVGPADWLAVEGDYFSVYNINDATVEEQAAVVSTGGFCNVQSSQTDVASNFVITTKADYDDVAIPFTHDCYYPRVRIGRPPATDDVVAYSFTRVPNLTPKPGVPLSVTANTDAVLQLDVRVVDTGEEEWQRGQNATFVVDFTASNVALGQTIVITPTIRTDQLTTICTQLNELPPTTITVTSTCSDPVNNGYITLSLSFGFSQPMLLPINITCQPQQQSSPLQSLSVDLVPGAQFVGTSSSRVPIVVNGSVPTTSAFNVVPSGGQPYTFAIPQRYVALTLNHNNVLNQTIIGRMTVGAASSLVGLSASSARTTKGSNTFSFAVQSSKLSVLIETQCEYSQQLQLTTVVIDTIKDDAGNKYDPIEFNYQWTCIQPPLFALSTRSPSGAQSTGNLIDQGQPSNTAGSNWQVDTNGTAGVINVNYNIQAAFDSMVGAAVYVTLQSPNATVFAWSLDTGSSVGLNNAAFQLSGTPIQSGSAFKNNIPLNPSTTVTSQLLLDQLVCSTREYVQVTTRLTYGWQPYVTITFRRHCDTADQFNYVTDTLSGGAVAAIVFSVLLTACCFMGCGWRYSNRGKRGWEILPFYDMWGQFQDRTLGPKRYTGPQMVDEDGMGEEVEISSTGGYGSTSYQNDL